MKRDTASKHTPGRIETRMHTHHFNTDSHKCERDIPFNNPLSSNAHWNTPFQLDTTRMTPTNLQTIFPNGIDVIIANLSTYPPTTLNDTPKIRPQEQALKNIIRLVHFIYTSQPRHIGYILANTPSLEKHPLIQEGLGRAIVLD